ncbi:MAG: hypothetical protein ACHQC8_02510 [Solirubrobacterales bacterium]
MGMNPAAMGGGGQLPGPTMPQTGPGQQGVPGVGLGPVGLHKKLKGKHHAAERKRLKTRRRGKRV